MKTIKFIKYEKRVTARLVAHEYDSNGTLAVTIENLDMDEDPPRWEPYARATVNLDPYTGRNDQSDTLAYFDMNGCGQEIADAIIAAGLAEPTGHCAASGYCIYPLYKWNINEF